MCVRLCVLCEKNGISFSLLPPDKITDDRRCRHQRAIRQYEGRRQEERHGEEERHVREALVTRRYFPCRLSNSQERDIHRQTNFMTVHKKT